MFSQLVIDRIGFYVYVLIDPRDQRPFYIGKGQGNRVFNHVAHALEANGVGEKCEVIRDIVKNGLSVQHVIIRHGLSGAVALDVESSLIDFCSYFDYSLTNLVEGHGSGLWGRMTADEIERRYSGEPLSEIEKGFVLININKTYRRAKGGASYYEATKESWSIHQARVKDLKYALSEYRGFIVEVFEISQWYEVPTSDKNGRPKVRWGFHGKQASEEIRKRYINKTVVKPKGAANPIRYNYKSTGGTATDPACSLVLSEC